MKRREWILMLGCMALTAVLLWSQVWFQNQRPTDSIAVDATAMDEIRAVQQLRSLLIAKPHQNTFVIRVPAMSNDRSGWNYLKYNRTKHLLIYKQWKYYPKGWHTTSKFPFIRSGFRLPVNTGCPDPYICEKVTATVILRSTPNDSIGTILMNAGCARTCLLVT